MEKPLKKQFYRPDEVSDLLRISTRTVFRMIQSGSLPGVRVSNKSWRIPRNALEEIGVKL